MRKIILTICTLSLLLSACARPLRVGSTTYDSYGLLTQDQKNPKIAYAVVWGNVFWGVFLVETIIAPIYFFGFSLFEPIGLAADYEPGQVRP